MHDHPDYICTHIFAVSMVTPCPLSVHTHIPPVSVSSKLTVINFTLFGVFSIFLVYVSVLSFILQHCVMSGLERTCIVTTYVLT